MADLPLLLAFWAAFALALASPGPNFALLLATAVRHGRGTALRVTAGLVLGEAVWGLAAVLGVAALAAGDPRVTLALRVGGGLYLLWLAAGALRSAFRPGGGLEAPAAGAPVARGGVRRGLGLMLLNAKAGFFWLSLTGLILGPDAGPSVGLAAVVGAVLLSALWHGLLAVAFTLPRVLRAYGRARRGIEAGLGVTLAGLGVRVLAAG